PSQREASLQCSRRSRGALSSTNAGGRKARAYGRSSSSTPTARRSSSTSRRPKAKPSLRRSGAMAASAAFDHLVVAAKTLEAGEDHLERLLAVRPKPGGHPRAPGPPNSLLHLGWRSC